MKALRALNRAIEFIGWAGELYARGRARGYSRRLALRQAIPSAWTLSRITTQ